MTTAPSDGAGSAAVSELAATGALASLLVTPAACGEVLPAEGVVEGGVSAAGVRAACEG